MDQAQIIAALEAELAGYIRRGLTDRADQVRHALRRLGGSTSTSAETVPTEPASTPTKPARASRKPVEASEEAEAPKTAKTARRPKK
jgi:hypothetical protein